MARCHYKTRVCLAAIIKCITRDSCCTVGAALGNNVAQLLGYDAAEGVLYGSLRDTRYVISSDDDSVTWLSSSLAAYDAATKRAGFVSSITVPWVKTGLLMPGATAPDAMYRSGLWGGECRAEYDCCTHPSMNFAI